jgi:hypothetical protein
MWIVLEGHIRKERDRRKYPILYVTFEYLVILCLRFILGDFRERFYCDRVSMPNAPQDMGNPHSVGRSYGGHARREAGIP